MCMHLTKQTVFGLHAAPSYCITNRFLTGATMLSIIVGHQIDTFTHILGDFATVSAIATTAYPVSTLVDEDGNPTGKTVNPNFPDHFAITGLLTSGVLASMIWRGGYTSPKGRRQFVWEIDGDEGSIRLESDALFGAFLNVRDPDLYLNGELVNVEGGGGMIVNLTNAWAEIAKGETGEYATIDDAVKNQKLLDAIERSIEEKRTIVF
jgi:predicted dehydrogenase